jgi:hypothetical protein
LRCSNIDQDLAERKRMRKREEGKKKGARAYTTYPPTHHMYVVICKKKKNYNKQRKSRPIYITLCYTSFQIIISK